MQKEKVKQAIEILNEKNVDLWLTFVRESEVLYDPVMDLILGTNVTWPSAFLLSRTGKRIAIMGSIDHERIKLTGLYDDRRQYIGGIGADLKKAIAEIDPQSIAINTSTNDYMSDGLTHGMYQILMGYLEGMPYGERLISAEGIVAALRGRKSASEIERIRAAVQLTEDIYDEVTGFIRAGKSELDVHNFIMGRVRANQVVTAWEEESCPAVFSGPESAGAHAEPTKRIIEKGHVLNIDFGVKKNDYCSDIQRTWYILRDGETEAPAEVLRGFNTIVESIQLAKEAIRPGKRGVDIDDVARNYITSKGYPEFPHALGHQVGRSTHDGAALLGPRWERYGNIPFMELEVGQVFTIEPRLPIEGYGVATCEEMIVITEDGCEWLSHPQTEIFLVK